MSPCDGEMIIVTNILLMKLTISNSIMITLYFNLENI